MILHLQPLDYWFWLIEFIIELAILSASFRRGMFMLSGFAASRVAFDILCFMFRSNESAYDLMFWVLKPLEYFFQILLALYCVEKVIQGERIYVRLGIFIVSITASLSVIAAYLLGPLRYTKLLDIETSVGLFVALGLFLGLLEKKGSRLWRLVSYGLIALGVSDSLLGMITPHFRQYWDIIARAYPVCEITALSVILAASMKGLPEFRLELGKRIELPKEEIFTRLM